MKKKTIKEWKDENYNKRISHDPTHEHNLPSVQKWQPNLLAPMPYVPIHYVGKIETPVNMRLNNHRKDAKSEAPILACKP